MARIRSALLWNGYMATFLAYGVFSIGKGVYQGVREIIRPSFPALGNFVFLEWLTAGNLPQPSKDGDSHDIVTWYRQWSGRIGELEAICHSVKGVVQSTVQGTSLVSVPSAIPPLSHLDALLRYVGWGAEASVRAIFDLLRGYWWHALLRSEASKAALVRM